MGKQAARKKTAPQRRKELFDLYVRRTDRINNWDLVDLAAHEVVGGYLFDKPRDLLYTFARSKNLWERRIAMYSTLYFMRHGQFDDLLAIAEILVNEPEEIVQKSVGTMLRGVSSDKPRLLAFLDKHAATMPRVMLRYAIEHLDADEKTRYLGLGKKAK
jgi:3-methyladenine DNA glycosylase AlkD